MDVPPSLLKMAYAKDLEFSLFNSGLDFMKKSLKFFLLPILP